MDTPVEKKKPKRVSLPDGVSVEEVDLAYAVKLIDLPRTVGIDPETDEEVVTGIGRYGPYVRRGKTFASLQTTEQLWSVDLEKAMEFIQAKESGKRLPLKELGVHEDTGNEIVVLSGRYGPYVTDGNVNANIPKGTDPMEVEMEEAVELLAKAAARKGKGGGRRRRKKK